MSGNHAEKLNIFGKFFVLVGSVGDKATTAAVGMECWELLHMKNHSSTVMEPCLASGW